MVLKDIEITIVHNGIPGCLPNSSDAFMSTDDAEEYAEDLAADNAEYGGGEVVDIHYSLSLADTLRDNGLDIADYGTYSAAVEALNNALSA